MKYLLILLSTILIISCTPADRFRQLKSPIILVAKDTNGTVALTDMSGKIVVIPETYYIAKAINNTYTIGDTLIYLK